MNPSAKSDYLEQRVRTASSAQLHLMLIDGGVRYAERAAQAFEENDAEAASQPLLRAMDIASELLAGVKHSQDEVNVKLASLYQFVFTRLTMAYVNTDREKLLEGVRVLKYQQETWRQAIDRATAEEKASTAAAQEAPKGPHQAAAKPATLAGVEMPVEGGLSLDA